MSQIQTMFSCTAFWKIRNVRFTWSVTSSFAKIVFYLTQLGYFRVRLCRLRNLYMIVIIFCQISAFTWLPQFIWLPQFCWLVLCWNLQQHGLNFKVMVINKVINLLVDLTGPSWIESSIEYPELISGPVSVALQLVFRYDISCELFFRGLQA